MAWVSVGDWNFREPPTNFPIQKYSNKLLFGYADGTTFGGCAEEAWREVEEIAAGCIGLLVGDTAKFHHLVGAGVDEAAAHGPLG